MKRNFVRAILVFAAVIFAAVISGGCGGSSGGIVTIPDNPTEPTPQTSARYVLAGSLTEARFDGSDLTPYLSERITEAYDTSDIAGLTGVINSLTSKDMLFFGNAAETLPENTGAAEVLTLLASLVSAYERGVAMVAVYADEASVRAMDAFVGFSFARPDPNAPYPLFELLGIARRPFADGIPHVFTYVAKCSGNHEYYSGMISNGTSDDFGPGLSVSGGHNEELCRSRVQALFDWQSELDGKIEEMKAEIESEVAAAVTVIDAKELERRTREALYLVQGVTTEYVDIESMPFSQYYRQNVYGRADKEGVLMASLDMLPQNLSVQRKTSAKYQVVSLHSFENHNDYYIVKAWVDTEPTLGRYDDMSLLSGFTKSLALYMWPGVKAERLEFYDPDKTLEGEFSYYGHRKWSINNGLSVTHKPQNTWAGQNNTGRWIMYVGKRSGIQLGYTYSEKLTYSSDSQESSNGDYKITPMPYTDSGTRVAKWNTTADWPGYTSGDYTLSRASGTRLSFGAEAIFRALPAERDSFEIYAKAGWGDGIAFDRGGKHYQFESAVDGAVVKPNFLRPLYTAVVTVNDNGYVASEDCYAFEAKLMTEAAWTAESDSDWLSVSTKSGGEGSSSLYYTARKNNTGEERTGTITVKSGVDEVYITYTQKAQAQ
ncbi:MAG: BACON domain-containing protein [Synergistaceae bacterium]|nr:BACON domain-containing protein [Synergistaceae bacterium]